MRSFTVNHLWVEVNDKIAIIGITNYGQDKLGDILFVNLPEIGDDLEIGQKFGDVESIKTVTDMISPVSGKILDVNALVVDDPLLINNDADNTWLIKVSIIELDELLTEENDG